MADAAHAVADSVKGAAAVIDRHRFRGASKLPSGVGVRLAKRFARNTSTDSDLTSPSGHKGEGGHGAHGGGHGGGHGGHGEPVHPVLRWLEVVLSITAFLMSFCLLFWKHLT